MSTNVNCALSFRLNTSKYNEIRAIDNDLFNDKVRIDNPITHSKLRVAFNNVYRRILKLPPRSSASTMYAVIYIDSLEILVRKRVVGFTERLKVSENSIISCIDNSWKMQFEIWNPWIKLLYK